MKNQVSQNPSKANMSSAAQQFVSVQFHHFKAFKSFEFKCRHFNILVGPNNAGKSTILAAFRILAAAQRLANSRRPTAIKGPNGRVPGYTLELSTASVAEENIFFNYDDDEAAWVRFHISNGNSLLLYFREVGSAYLIPELASGMQITEARQFKVEFSCPIGFVPILGPVEHKEPLFQKEAAQRALFSYSAARNFRNIWYHFPDRFDEFRSTLQQTWPGMDIEKPTLDASHDKSLLHMFCPEARVPREIFWSGFGFQVWCQMLTHLIQSRDKSIFLIDEPDIYLHSDLQRQLLSLLRNLGPGIIVATHSTEIVADAEADEIVVIDKKQLKAKRIQRPAQLAGIFAALGSNLNPVLTQLAKTKRVVFVEGQDFQILGKFGAKCGFPRVASRADFAVITAEGFNPERVKNLREGMAQTLGTPIRTAVVFDRDFRSASEIAKIKIDCEAFCDLVQIHECKEIENFLLIAKAIDRAAEKRLAERARRTGKMQKYFPRAQETLDEFSESQKSYFLGQRTARYKQFEKWANPGRDEASYNQVAFEQFERDWSDQRRRLAMLPGKMALAAINKVLQENYDIHVTPTSIIEAMSANEIPAAMMELLSKVDGFRRSAVATSSWAFIARD